MGNVRINETTRNLMLDLISDAIDAGAGAGLIRIYDGTQPADSSVAITSQTLLATLTFTDPGKSTLTGGVLTFAAITDDASADATSTATWARIIDSDLATVFDCDVGVTGSGATIEFNTVEFVAAKNVSMTSFTLTIPAS